MKHTISLLAALTLSLATCAACTNNAGDPPNGTNSSPNSTDPVGPPSSTPPTDHDALDVVAHYDDVQYVGLDPDSGTVYLTTQNDADPTAEGEHTFTLLAADFTGAELWSKEYDFETHEIMYDYVETPKRTSGVSRHRHGQLLWLDSSDSAMRGYSFAVEDQYYSTHAGASVSSPIPEYCSPMIFEDVAACLRRLNNPHTATIHIFDESWREVASETFQIDGNSAYLDLGTHLYLSDDVPSHLPSGEEESSTWSVYFYDKVAKSFTEVPINDDDLRPSFPEWESGVSPKVVPLEGAVLFNSGFNDTWAIISTQGIEWKGSVADDVTVVPSSRGGSLPTADQATEALSDMDDDVTHITMTSPIAELSLGHSDVSWRIGDDVASATVPGGMETVVVGPHARWIQLISSSASDVDGLPSVLHDSSVYLDAMTGEKLDFGESNLVFREHHDGFDVFSDGVNSFDYLASQNTSVVVVANPEP